MFTDDEIVGILCRSLPLSEDEWLRLVRYRQSQISQLLGGFTLPKIRDNYCLNRGSENTNIGSSEVEVESPEGLTLDAQGIYRKTREKEYQAVGDTWVRLSGLERSNFWIGVTIYYLRDTTKVFTEIKLTKVVIEKMASIEELKKRAYISSYADLWHLLGEPVDGWLKARRLLMEKLERTVAEVHFQDRVLFNRNKARPVDA